MPQGSEPRAGHPLRLLVFSTVYPNAAQPHHGVFVRERMRGLSPDFEVVVVAPTPWFPGTRILNRLRPGWRPEAPREEVQDGVRVLHPRFLSFPGIFKCLDGLLLFLGALPALLRLRRTFRFEAIDAHFVYPEGTAAALLGRVFRVPVVITLRGLLPLVARHRLRRPQARYALRRAARLIAVSETLKRDAVALGVPPERVRVIGNGVDGDVFRPRDRREARRALGLPESGPLVLSVGTLSPRKGFHLVIEALPELARAFPEIRFAIVGGAGAEGAMEPELRALAERLGVAGRTLFAGPRGRAELALWYAAADLFVLASGHEGCPNVVLEALACGTPVVATPAGDVPEIVGPEEGWVVPREVPAISAAISAAIAVALRERRDPERVRARIARRDWRAVGAEAAEEVRAAVGLPAPELRDGFPIAEMARP